VEFANGTVGIINCSQSLSQLAVEEPKLVAMDELFIDVACKDRASCPVAVGDPANFARPCVEQNGYMINKSMDDRISCVTEIEALKRLSTPAYDSYFVFSVQEEVGLRGATTSGFGVDPHFAIAIDVTPTRDFPEARPLPVVLGGGAAIKVKDSGMIAHPRLKDWMVKVAKENNIRYQLEVLDFGSTDGRAIQMARAGVVTGVVSIPTRHIHSPSEMVYVDDVEQCVRLIAAVVSKPIEI
jgi:endoglucanase